MNKNIYPILINLINYCTKYIIKNITNFSNCQLKKEGKKEEKKNRDYWRSWSLTSSFNYEYVLNTGVHLYKFKKSYWEEKCSYLSFVTALNHIHLMNYFCKHFKWRIAKNLQFAEIIFQNRSFFTLQNRSFLFHS